ncbi:hypothetical protein F5Y15DRAFT_223485 [Xylariaceae sp. FL0016]|nr:hypothetical protein F5Y15DRAFT_223485 [Xylariaceae sp. FL0016]
MAPPPIEQFSNRFFTFVVGEEAKEYVIHADVFANLSTPLSKIINGDSTTAVAKRIDWEEEVDTGTFERLMQWAYSGDYGGARPGTDARASPPRERHARRVIKIKPARRMLKIKPKDVKDIKNDIFCLSESEEEDERDSSCTIDAESNNRGKDAIWLMPYSMDELDAFRRTNPDVAVRIYSKLKMAMKFMTWDPKSDLGPLQTDATNTHRYESYQEVFLAHVPLLRLAAQYQIPHLQSAVRFKLYSILKRFKLYKERIGDIAALIHHIYKNTSEWNVLRCTLVTYAAAIAEDVGGDDDWQEMLRDTPEFAVDLLLELSNDRLGD